MDSPQSSQRAQKRKESLLQTIEDVKVGGNAGIGIDVALEIRREGGRRGVDEPGGVDGAQSFERRALTRREIDGKNMYGNFGAADQDVLFIDPLNRDLTLESAWDGRSFASRDVIEERVAIRVQRGDEFAVLRDATTIPKRDTLGTQRASRTAVEIMNKHSFAVLSAAITGFKHAMPVGKEISLVHLNVACVDGVGLTRTSWEFSQTTSAPGATRSHRENPLAVGRESGNNTVSQTNRR